MKRWVIGVCFVVLTAGCGKAPEPEAKEPEPVLAVQTAISKIGSVRELLPMDGSFVLAPGDFARLAPVTSGRLTAVFVKEGDLVRQGQLLATIDTSVQSAQRSGAVAGVSAANAQAQQSEASLQAARADYLASVKAAELALQAAIIERDAEIGQATAELNKVLAGARPQEIAQAEQNVRQAQVNRDRARAEAQRDRRLLGEGLVSGQQADASEAAFQLAESSLAQAIAQLQIVRQGARKEEVDAAKLRVNSARAIGDKKVEAARAVLDQTKAAKLALEAKAKEVQAAKFSASVKQSDQLAAQGAVANGEIHAPFGGVVTKRMMNPGDIADPAMPVLEVSRTGATVEFSAQVPPRSALKLMKGIRVMPPGSTEDLGTVTGIGTPDPQTGQVSVRIRFLRPPDGVTAGSFARVLAVINIIPNAITVPEAAVVSREDGQVVFVVEGDVAKMVSVELGPTEGGNVAVLKGLKAGQKVVLVGQHELSDGAKVSDEQAGGAK